MYWKSVTKDRYDKVLKIVPGELDLPKGAQFRVAPFTDDGMHFTDIWDAPEDSANLQRHRLISAIMRPASGARRTLSSRRCIGCPTPGFTPTK